LKLKCQIKSQKLINVDFVERIVEIQYVLIVRKKITSNLIKKVKKEIKLKKMKELAFTNGIIYMTDVTIKAKLKINKFVTNLNKSRFKMLKL